MLSVILLNVSMVSVIMLNVGMLNVLASDKHLILAGLFIAKMEAATNLFILWHETT
jgi:hypothetical protein